MIKIKKPYFFSIKRFFRKPFAYLNSTDKSFPLYKKDFEFIQKILKNPPKLSKKARINLNLK
ncbi:MAG: hypothetical protein ACTSXL_04130 [Alphaproteobacteria bacterium]|nr:MAG: hypothetical protein B6I23_01905 [Rickettsiaceae bacterium 4572_127]